MKVLSIFGTRPEMIKMWGTLKKLDDLNFVSLFIEKFYNDLIEKSSSNNFEIFFNRLKILNRINLMRKFNLDAKDTFFYVKNILKNDQR